MVVLIGKVHMWPILRSLWKFELLYLGVALYAASVQHLADHPQYNDSLRHVVSMTMLDLPFAAVMALGSALAIFLAFRNNSAYGRWWEARTLWGALVNSSRTWARQVLSFVEIEGAEGEGLHRELVLRQVAYVHALRLHLRQQPEHYAAELGRLLPAAELEDHLAASNVPANIALWQGRALREARRAEQLSEYRHVELDRTLTALLDIQGGCERIKNTPIPRQFDQFPRFFTVVFALLLPFGLADSIGWLTPLVSVPLAGLFTLLDDSGRVIENPFENSRHDTPMTALSVTIERDLRSHLGETELRSALEPVDEVLM